ncbi:glutaredoxin family protein [Halanaerobium praevalens]|uniref:Glutaredoxin n=1 Tax=Halanaerobium praevalens (strain ATCC 33744 / DSM 2228 / GSL) TaxID=572479 RepID=E3DMJ3_HALPG|nr:glutathione S-transferase N-terminal domain-containing protein [Halanaerobium praevalens]ADO77401.1 glutaredoxin [Halanaerobium praevalens DSM 2228]
MSDLSLYYFPSCPYCRRVLDFIEENELENIELKNIRKDKAAKDKLIEVGGKSQVPCLLIDDEPLYESNDIINWLQNNLLEN